MKPVTNSQSFKFLIIKAINPNSGNSYEKSFTMNLVEGGVDAIDEVLAEQVKVYPVPAVDVLNIETPDAEGKYAIYNVAGMLLQSGDIRDNVTTLDVSGLSKGSYMLRYSASQGVVTKAFIVK